MMAGPDGSCPVGGPCQYGCPGAECYRERTRFADTPFAAVTLQAPNGERGVLIGPAGKVADLVRPEAVVDVPWSPCGDDCHLMTAEHPAANACSHCAPRTCETCGGVNDLATDRMCGCWIDLRTLAPADVKALFAADGWNVGTDGRLTR